VVHHVNNKFSTVNRDVSPGKASIGATANGSVIAQGRVANQGF